MSCSQVKLSIPSNIEYLSSVRSFICSIMQDENWNEEQTTEIEIAIDEVVTNVIEHVYGFSTNYLVMLTLKLYPQKVVIDVEDEGKPFDPTQILVPNLEEVTKRRQMIGKYLIQQFSSKIEYRSTKKGGNILRIIKDKKVA